ncbi:MAG: hypothetical protein WBF99_01250 [Xanthobacteraceae bacterium]
MVDRLMMPGRVALEGGNIVVKDEHGVKRLTNDPREATGGQRGFDINRHRLIAVETMIDDRYGGPCDCDDARAYLSVAFNALALSRRLTGWKADARPLIAWARRWTPLADPLEVERLAIAVTTAPRWISAARAGKLMAATTAEIERLGIKTVWASDRSVREIKREKKLAKNKADRERVAAARAAKRGRAGGDMRLGSVTVFCKTHKLPRSTVYRHLKDGTLDGYLAARGIQARPDGWDRNVALNRDSSSYSATHSSHVAARELGTSILAFQRSMVPAIQATASATVEISRKVVLISKAARRIAPGGAA